MDKNLQTEMTQRFQAAADSFVHKVKNDPNVIAVIICGSLAYDQVWEKSDIDMTLVVRDQVLKHESYSVLEDDITINVYTVVRSGFKRYLDSIHGGSIQHSYFARGKIIFSNDDSLFEYFEDFKTLGSDDQAQTVFYLACELVHHYDKCLKWLTVKKDPLYAQFYLLKTSEVLARMEVCLSGESPSREAIIKAKALNGDLIRPYYDGAMARHYKEEEIMEYIQGIDAYLMQHLDIIKKPALDYMSDGEIKTLTMLTKFFRTDSHFIVGIFDYLADKGIIAKVSQTIRITPKSKPSVEEIAYQYVPYDRMF